MTTTEHHDAEPIEAGQAEQAAFFPEYQTGTHDTKDGAGKGTPWPDDVPPGQDDTWYPLRDDPWKARRMEYFIAMLWGVTAVCGLGLMTVYWTGGQTQLEGYLLLAGFGCMGTGLLLWARNLLPGHEVTAVRHQHISEPEVRAAVVDSLSRGSEAMLSRRGFLAKKVLVPVGGIFGIAALWPLASLGPRTGNALYHTKWYPGARLVTEDGTPVTVDDVEVDGIITVWPEGHINNAQSPAVLINIGGDHVEARRGQAGFEVVSGANGLVAFSKICTHAGCAVSLFNVLSMQLICPCHQSTFNILQDCKPVFGPASRPLPQLPLGVAPGGFLIARSDFIEPIGPGFWNRAGD